MNEEKPEDCLCGYKTEKLRFYKYGRGGWLCEICASTPAGNVWLYPAVHQGADTDLLKTVVMTTHMILERLHEPVR